MLDSAWCQRMRPTVEPVASIEALMVLRDLLIQSAAGREVAERASILSPGSSPGDQFNQLRQYALALENPPLLIVSDMVRFRIRTNWTNSVSLTHEFTLEDLAEAAKRDKLKWSMSDPERLRPGESRQALTERAAATFAELAQSLRDRGHEPQAVAHFVTRLVFCMFAEDVGLLPDNMFTRMLGHARKRPGEFAVCRAIWADVTPLSSRMSTSTRPASWHRRVSSPQTALIR